MSTDETLRIGGLGSGMDIQGTIEALLKADAERITTAQGTQDTRNQKIAAWTTVKDSLAAFTNASNSLRWMDLWRQITATSSDPAVLTATAASTATKTSYAIEVLQMARAQSIGSAAGLTTGGAAPEPVTASTLLVDIAGISVGDQFAIAGQSFTIEADDTLATLRTKINDASASMPEDQQVTASILDNRLVLQRAQTGDASIVLSDTTGSPLQALGILNAMGEPANELLSAQNALFTVNGALVERSANTGLADVIDGVTYEIDVTQPARYAINGQLANPNAQRIRNLSFGGKPIDPQARFIVATNNYRAYGGGNFPGVTGAKVVLDAPDENRQALVDYLSQSAGSKINPSADGNWRIAPTGTVEATFLSSSNAARFLAQHPGIRLVKDNGDGSAVYGLKP